MKNFNESLTNDVVSFEQLGPDDSISAWGLKAEGLSTAMSQVLIWSVIWKMPYHNLFLIFFSNIFPLKHLLGLGLFFLTFAQNKVQL